MDSSSLQYARLNELIFFAVENDLISSCHITRGHAVIALGQHHLSYSHEEATAFLRLLLQGWMPLEQGEPPLRTTPKRGSLFPTMEAPEHPGSRSSSSGRQYAEELLAFSKRMNLIEDYHISPRTDKVTVHTMETSTQMSLPDVLQFLSSVIVDKAEFLSMQFSATP